MKEREEEEGVKKRRKSCSVLAQDHRMLGLGGTLVISGSQALLHLRTT